MKSIIFLAVLSCILFQSVAAQADTEVDVISLRYTDTVDSSVIQLQGYMSLPADATSVQPAPAVVILPDADGVNFYEQVRATMLAKDLGYVGFAADIYGANLQNVTDRVQRTALLNLYRNNITLYTQRIKAAVDFIKSQPEVDPNNVAVIGYCFGGTGVLQYGLVGGEGVVGLVSFHGGLVNLPEVGPGVKPKLLVLSGGDDDTSTRIADLENT
jgi:dienelactone hydrolase